MCGIRYFSERTGIQNKKNGARKPIEAYRTNKVAVYEIILDTCTGRTLTESSRRERICALLKRPLLKRYHLIKRKIYSLIIDWDYNSLCYSGGMLSLI